LFFGALAVAQDGLRFVLIAPEIRVSRACFEAFQALAVLRGVKDNSEPWRCGVLVLRGDIADLPESFHELAYSFVLFVILWR
jgi:hypothetical protein